VTTFAPIFSIPYNPVFFSYAVVTATSATLYIDSEKLPAPVLENLSPHVTIRPYEAIFSDLDVLAELVALDGNSPSKKYLVSDSSSWALTQRLGGPVNVEEIRSPIASAKSVKNDTELAGMRACHVRDGAALIQYFAWLEDQLLNKKAVIDEAQAADKLEAFRSTHQYFAGLSFDTISSTGANAAVIHYKPEPGSCAIIDPKAIYLCDSGAQYFDGTTDTTRTLHFGTPTDMEKHAYTLVLKGHIALDQARFPKGTTGLAIDGFARQFLWNEGLDYRHGTGHGVGSFLNVHEGPMGIGTRVEYSRVPLAVANVLSNEPGYYEDGAFGIRIENIVVVREVSTRYKFGGEGAVTLGFEHVTMVPMCKSLLKTDILTPGEIAWLDEYHAEVREKTMPFFAENAGDGEEEAANKRLARAWLERETAPVSV